MENPELKMKLIDLLSQNYRDLCESNEKYSHVSIAVTVAVITVFGLGKIESGLLYDVPVAAICAYLCVSPVLADTGFWLSS